MSGMITGSAEAELAAAQETPEILRGDDDLPQVLGDTVTDFFHAPRARGLIHAVCAATAIIAGAVLVPVAWLDLPPRAVDEPRRPEVDEAGRSLDDLHLHRR
jgi:hemolysin III